MERREEAREGERLRIVIVIKPCLSHFEPSAIFSCFLALLNGRQLPALLYSVMSHTACNLFLTSQGHVLV